MMRRARSRSLSEFDFTSTIRFPYVFPARTIAAVVSMFRTILVAVPAFSRVEPAMTSGPTPRMMATSARSFSADRGSQVTPMMGARAARALATAPRTNGVIPLAEIPITTSLRVGLRPRMARSPAS